MSHIAKHKIGIKNFNMELLKEAVNYARRELVRYRIEIRNNEIVISDGGLYRPVIIREDGNIIFDDMNRHDANRIEKTVKKYYLMVASILSLKKMGYDVEFNITKKGEIQILGEA